MGGVHCTVERGEVGKADRRRTFGEGDVLPGGDLVEEAAVEPGTGGGVDSG